MKTLLITIAITLSLTTTSQANDFRGMGSLIPSFHYLNSDKAKLVLKPVKVNLPKIVGGGKASYYWQGQRTANGEAFEPDGISCAHKTLPFNTRIRVTNLNNGKSVVCRVNDRGPFIAGRVVDLSRGAARVIDMTGAGVVPVNLEVL